MLNTRLDTSRVLIVPGYTDQEILLRSNEKTKNQVVEPTSFLFEAMNIESQPHRPSYEEFRPADGTPIQVEKTCDEPAQVTMDILVHQNISNTKGTLMIDKQSKEIRLRVTDNSAPEETDIDGELTLSRFVRPEEFTEEYIEVRENFFKDLLGRPLTMVSPLFEAIPVCYINDYHYNIPAGEEEATYSVSFVESATTGF